MNHIIIEYEYILYIYIWVDVENIILWHLRNCRLYIQGGPQKMQKLNEYPVTKSVNYEFIRAWQIWKTSNIAALTIDVL